MPTEFTYASVLEYSPRGTSEVEVLSRKVTGNIKNPRPAFLSSLIKKMEGDREMLSDFLSPDVTLIPIPRSSLLKTGQLWPSLELCNALIENGFGGQVYACLNRKIPIASSHLHFDQDSRPSIDSHLQSLEVKLELSVPKKITLVDDVITAGKTAIASFIKIKEMFPDAEIKIFVFVRTESFKEVEKIYSPHIGTIILHDSGKTFRN